ncbi:MAG: 3-oxoadipate enol-lactonase [Burkholderiales bacterium]|nr:MAG: 3-oxoadipate enol-lactonase [Burkholderiales bacterium]
MQHATVDGVRIAYQTAGKAGPWVVLSHSIACDHSMWEPQIRALERHYRILAFDTRGHGASDAPPGPYSFEQLSADALGLMDALAIDHAHFVGLSMGGMIGQHAALGAPDRFLSLTLADTTSRYPAEARGVWDQRMVTAREQGLEPLVAPTLERWFTQGFRAAHPEMVDRIGRLIRSTAVDGYVGCAQAIIGMNLTDRLGAIHCPVLVIVGAEDQSTPVAMHEEIHRAIPQSRLVVLPNAAHLSNIEQPGAFTAELLGFLVTAAG